MCGEPTPTTRVPGTNRGVPCLQLHIHDPRVHLCFCVCYLASYFVLSLFSMWSRVHISGPPGPPHLSSQQTSHAHFDNFSNPGTAALTCPEAEVLIILGTELLQQRQEENSEGVLDPEHRTVAPHGGEHDQPPPAALGVHEVKRISSWNGAGLRGAHLAVQLALFGSLRGLGSGRRDRGAVFNGSFRHCWVPLGLAEVWSRGWAALVGHVHQGERFQSCCAPPLGRGSGEACPWPEPLPHTFSGHRLKIRPPFPARDTEPDRRSADASKQRTGRKVRMKKPPRVPGRRDDVSMETSTAEQAA